jgi:hypothetical protein
MVCVPADKGSMPHSDSGLPGNAFSVTMGFCACAKKLKNKIADSANNCFKQVQILDCLLIIPRWLVIISELKSLPEDIRIGSLKEGYCERW